MASNQSKDKVPVLRAAYIVRDQPNSDGYRPYVAQAICPMTDPAQWHDRYCGCYHWTNMPHNNYTQWCRVDKPVRHLKVPESMLNGCWRAWNHSLWTPMFAKQPKGPTKAPRLRSKGPALTDDPIEDGRDVAKSDIPLPSDARTYPAARYFSASNTTRSFSSTDKDFGNLYRAGILYDEEDVGSDCAQESLEISDLRPSYAICFKAPKQRQRGGTKVGSLVDFELIDAPSASELGCTYSGEFDLVVEDDLISNAGSWVVLDGD